MSVEMKDSGVAWIGEIPNDWKISLLSSLFFEHSLKNIGMQENNLLSLSYGKIIRKNIDENGGLLPASFEGYNIISPNDIVFRLTDLQNDKRSLRTGLCMEKGIITSAYITIRKRDNNLSSRYFHYLLHSYDECKVFYGIGNGVRQGMNYQDLRKLLLTFPPTKEEQSRIANFLDKKCAEIDELIALQEQMIAQLNTYKQAVITETVTKGLDPNVKMKDSGVEWIGEIPEHWEVKRIKNVCNCLGRIGFRGYTNDDMVQEGEGAITLSPSNMKNMTMDYSKCSYLSWNKYYESPEIQIQVGDVLFVKTGSTYGKSSYVHEIPMECTINPQIICFKDHRESAKFLNYLLNTPMAKGQVDITVVGGTIPTIAQSKIINYSFAFPPLSEQQSIAQYLDRKCKEIDELIFIKKEKIEHLKAYKKSVIFEYVTGKKETL